MLFPTGSKETPKTIIVVVNASEPLNAQGGFFGVCRAIGSADLGLSLGKRGMRDPTDTEVLAAIATIARSCDVAGKGVGSHTGSVAFARRAIDDHTFDFATILSDGRILSRFGAKLVADELLLCMA